LDHLEDKLNEFEGLVQMALCQSNKWTPPTHTISKQQFLLLHTLHLNQRMTISELAEQLYLSPSATTIAINRLVRDGNILRTRDESDRSVVWVELTEKAHEMVIQLRSRRKTVLRSMFSNLTEEEIAQFLAITRKMLTHIQDPG
jgi:DNA-binding MarR family transcriptional regulator